MKLKNSKMKLLKILFLFIMLQTNKSTVYSQTTSADSLKCFTYSEARKIITDLRQLPVKDSIIKRQDSIITIDELVIISHEKRIDSQHVELFKKDSKISKLKKNRKFFIIFGALLGLATQLLF